MSKDRVMDHEQRTSGNASEEKPRSPQSLLTPSKIYFFYAYECSCLHAYILMYYMSASA